MIIFNLLLDFVCWGNIWCFWRLKWCWKFGGDLDIVFCCCDVVVEWIWFWSCIILYFRYVMYWELVLLKLLICLSCWVIFNEVYWGWGSDVEMFFLGRVGLFFKIKEGFVVVISDVGYGLGCKVEIWYCVGFNFRSCIN